MPVSRLRAIKKEGSLEMEKNGGERIREDLRLGPQKIMSQNKKIKKSCKKSC